jgi:hypothetical protein
VKTLITSVGFQDEAGNLLANGSLILTLPPGLYVIVSGGGQVVGQSLIINLDATAKITGTVTIWASDEISLQTPYTATLCQQANGLQPVGTAVWFVGGTSPIDLSLMTPTTSGVSFSGAVLLNPTSSQFINGQTLNLEGASLGFSAASSTVADSFLSRLASGVVGIGTVIGNALGTLRAAVFQIGGSDTGLSRTAAATIAVGNGTSGDASGTVNSGTINATTYQVGGASQTGTGPLVAKTSPALVTPDIGAATATSISQKAATTLLVKDNTGGTRFSVPSNGTSQSTLNNTLITGGSTYGGTTRTLQKFTSSGTFTIPANITSTKVTVVGGGGAGGGSTAANNGGGGGSGSIAIKYLSGLTPGNTLTVTVGAGGTGISAATGNVGSASSISSGTQTISTVSAPGGGGGFQIAAQSPGGAGGVVATGGDINGGGASGTNSTGAVSGGGGPTFLGGPGNPASGGPGNAALANTGSGGGGAGVGASTAGGAGGSGIVIFEWVT